MLGIRTRPELLLLLGMWWMALPGRACERPTLTHMLFLSAWLGARCTVPESKTAKALCRKLPKRVAVIFSDAQKQAKPGRAAKRKQCRAWGRGGKPLSVLWKGSRSGSSGAGSSGLKRLPSVMSVNTDDESPPEAEGGVMKRGRLASRTIELEAVCHKFLGMNELEVFDLLTERFLVIDVSGCVFPEGICIFHCSDSARSIFSVTAELQVPDMDSVVDAVASRIAANASISTTEYNIRVQEAKSNCNAPALK